MFISGSTPDRLGSRILAETALTGLQQPVVAPKQPLIGKRL
jgi:hypothetical protein